MPNIGLYLNQAILIVIRVKGIEIINPKIKEAKLFAPLNIVKFYKIMKLQAKQY